MALESRGIHPFNPEIFSKEDFLCSAVTDRQMPVDKESLIPSSSSSSTLETDNTHENLSTPPTTQSLGVSKTVEVNRDVSATSPTLSTSTALGQEVAVIVTPEMIKPYPKDAPQKTTRRGRQRGKTTILTKTPEKKDDQNLEPQEEPKKKKPRAQKLNKKQANKSKKERVKRKILGAIDNETENFNFC